MASPQVAHVLARAGRPLEAALLQDLQRRLHRDFSNVRVHTDAQAAKSARAVNATAYTVGSHVVFAANEYRPSTAAGRTLLVHELAHTLQQRGRGSAETAGGALPIAPAGTALERAADDFSTGARRASDLPATDGIVLQRQAASGTTREATPTAGESLFTVFVADSSKRTDVRFARREAQADAARIRKSGTLSTDDRQLVNAKLRFFEGEAWRVYGAEIRPALLEVAGHDRSPSPAAPSVSTPTPARPPLSRPSAPVRRQRDPQVDWFIHQTIDELDDDAREKVLIALLLNVMKLGALREWGLALAEHHDHVDGNYLLKFFKETWNKHVFEREGDWDIIIEKLADQGVMVRQLELAWELHLVDIDEQSKPLRVDIRQYPVIAWKAAVGDLLKPLVDAFDLVIHLLPVVGEVVGAIEALSGREIITGEKLKGWERFLGALPLAPEFIRAPRAVARMISAYARETRIAESLLVKFVGSTERLSRYESQLRSIEHTVEQAAHLPAAERPLLVAADRRVLAEAHDALAPLATEIEGARPPGAGPGAEPAPPRAEPVHDEPKPSEGASPKTHAEAPTSQINEDVHPEDELPREPSAHDPTVDIAICFPGDALVSCPSGPRPIESLRTGEEVHSHDARTNRVVVARVTHVTRGSTSAWIDVRAGDQIVRATPGHPFWVTSKSSWVPAAELKVGHTLRCEDGSELPVQAVDRRVLAEPEPTYNLSVGETETFFVGDARLLVHNLTRSRLAYLKRAGYTNYVLRDRTGRIYYSGMFGPGDTAAGVRYRHSMNHNRFNPANGDTMELRPGTRTYGEARLMEHRIAVTNNTIRVRGGTQPNDYRCNRQEPLSESKIAEYREYDQYLKGCG